MATQFSAEITTWLYGMKESFLKEALASRKGGIVGYEYEPRLTWSFPSPNDYKSPQRVEHKCKLTICDLVAFQEYFGIIYMNENEKFLRDRGFGDTFIEHALKAVKGVTSNPAAIRDVTKAGSKAIINYHDVFGHARSLEIEVPEETFWMVFVQNNKGTSYAPKFKHTTRQSAETEADRLAKLTGEPAFVLQAVERFEVTAVNRTKLG